MSCPTCDHTMHTLASNIEGDMRYSVCPRCGTVTVDMIGPGGIAGARHRVSTWVPKLVERCREFGKRFTDPVCEPDQDPIDWKRLGIAESINVPEDRK